MQSIGWLMDGIHDCVSVSRIAMEWKAYHLDAKDVLLTGTRTIVKIHSYRCPITLLMVSPCKNTLHCTMICLCSKASSMALQSKSMVDGVLPCRQGMITQAFLLGGTQCRATSIAFPEMCMKHIQSISVTIYSIRISQ